MLWLLLTLHAMRQVSPLPEGGGQPPWIREKRLGSWRLLASIGKGNFGEVFLAEDPAGNRKALKVFLPEQGDRRAFDLEYDGMERAQRLTQAPGLVPVDSTGRTEYCIFYTMPLADALQDDPYTPHMLYNRMVRNDLSEAELLDLTVSVLDGLVFLHGEKLVHRDIKPDNILKVAGKWCLADPGLLSPRRPGRFAGTPGFYPAKKSFRADEGGDLYALGKTLYCAATGMKPENYPLVPEHYDYARYPALRRLYRCAAEGKYRTAGEMKKEAEILLLNRKNTQGAEV